MPGHFTHIYTARRVADLLASGAFCEWSRGSSRMVNPPTVPESGTSRQPEAQAPAWTRLPH
jgi:hypothetical protein